MKPYPGCLIVFEGTDGTGKSTQLELLAQKLKATSFQVVTTREPTAGVHGQKIRELYVNRINFSPEEELELFIADRKDHVDKLLLPSLQAGKIILCDRYFLSTAAYQGAIGFNPHQIISLNSFAPEPDLAFVFSAPAEESLKRITESRGDQPNDFEKLESLKKVATIFNSLTMPYIRKINATLTIPQIHNQIVTEVKALLGTEIASTRE